MKIISVGYNFRHDENFSVSRHEGLQECLFLIIRSPARFRIGEKNYSVSPDSLIFVDARTPHFFSADHEPFVNDWVAVCFDEKERALLLENKIRPNTFFQAPEVNFCSDIIRLMQAESLSVNTYKEDTLARFLDILLRKLYELSDCFTQRKRYYSLLKRLRDKIYQSPRKEHTLQSLANEVNLSKSYFQALYRTYFGVPPMTDVIVARMEYAKQLLVYTDDSVATIAETLGYWSDAQFIKQFKAFVKTTPLQYRKGKG